MDWAKKDDKLNRSRRQVRDGFIGRSRKNKRLEWLPKIED
jgi:hypothetical protein